MFNYLYGTIVQTGFNTIVVDVNGVGYELFVSHPEDYQLDKKMMVYVYMHVREDEVSLYGFSNKEEKRLFMRLISVSGIGPKTTITMLGQTSVDNMITAIETSNTAYLKKLPGIGPKAAQQIILDLKGKLVVDEAPKLQRINAALEDAKEALKNLGFKVGQIDKVLTTLSNEDLTTEEYLRKALQLLRR